MNLKKAKRLRKQLKHIKVVDREYTTRQMKVKLWEVVLGCEEAIKGIGFDIINYPMKDGTAKQMIAGFSTQIRLKEGCRRKMYKELKNASDMCGA